jgi:endonuclease/exonuclease/phosphatase family metal-dependent hydrolase
VTNLLPLTALSWNVALLARSTDAPLSWDQTNSEAAIRAVILEHSPDLVLFQELPGFAPYVETHDLVPLTTRTHSGSVGILLGNDLADETWLPSQVEGCGVLVHAPDRQLTIANVHLAPGPGASALRLAQLTAIAAAAPTETLVILGDTNTRVNEMALVEQLGLETPRPPAVTWDSARNPFHRGPEFQALFTRAFSRGSVAVTKQEVVEGRVEFQDHSFYLSDHFALRVDLEPC